MADLVAPSSVEEVVYSFMVTCQLLCIWVSKHVRKQLKYTAKQNDEFVVWDAHTCAGYCNLMVRFGFLPTYMRAYTHSNESTKYVFYACVHFSVYVLYVYLAHWEKHLHLQYIQTDTYTTAALGHTFCGPRKTNSNPLLRRRILSLFQDEPCRLVPWPLCTLPNIYRVASRRLWKLCCVVPKLVGNISFLELWALHSTCCLQTFAEEQEKGLQVLACAQYLVWAACIDIWPLLTLVTTWLLTHPADQGRMHVSSHILIGIKTVPQRIVLLSTKLLERAFTLHTSVRDEIISQVCLNFVYRHLQRCSHACHVDCLDSVG